MKSRYLIYVFIFIGCAALAVFDAIYNEANSHTSGASAGRTGSPGDGGLTCKSCHAGPNPATEAGLITSNIPGSGYVAGQTYTITAAIARSGHTKFGFEISPQNISGSLLGTLIVTNTTEMQLVGSGKYITHKSAGVSGTNARTWTFDWTAPASGTGDVTFYGAFNVTNNMNNSSGDTVVVSTLTVSECAALAQPGPISGTAVLCQGGGGLYTYSISPVAGATSYQWTFPAGWSGFSNTNSIDLMPGTSGGTITVTAVNDCGSSTASILAVSFSGLSVNNAVTAITCHGNANGSVDANVSSGVQPYTYLWSNGATTSAINNLGAGNYSVTVTDGAGCTATASSTIVEPAQVFVNASTSNSFCGNANGSATAIANGGTGSISYLWSTGQTTAAITNLFAGNYSVTATDQHGCSANTSASVSDVPGPSAAILSSVNAQCHGSSTGSAIATQTGGTAPFLYAWSPAGGNAATAANLSAGNYTVTITDANNCTSAASVNITEPPAITLNTSVNDASCGNANGSATVLASGGTGVLSYSWNTVPVQTNFTAVNLVAGNYTVTITDGNSCTSSTSVTVNDIPGPSANAVVVSDVSCSGGADGEVAIHPAGGTPPYTFLWSPSGGTDSLAHNVTAGIYFVTVTDANGCTGTNNVTVSEPTPITLTTSSTDAACGQSNGSAAVNATGGAGNFQYAWSTIPVQTTNVATNLPAGSYTVTVIDNSNCMVMATVGVSNVSGPALGLGTSIDATCFNSGDGAVSVVVNGGTGPYTYLWSPAGGIDTLATNLHAGSYSVTVTDAAGCISVLTAVVHEPTALVADAGLSTGVCLGSSLVLGSSPVASGGTAGYQFSWSPATGLSSVTDSTPVATPFVNTGYMLVVTDAHGCTDTSEVQLSLHALPLTPVITATTDTLFSSPANGYQWYLDGNILNGFNDQYCIPFQNGNYSVMITDVNGCSAVSADYFYSSTGIAVLQAPPVLLYPNPASDKLNVFTGNHGATAILFFNPEGEKVLQFTTALQKSEVDVQTLSPGIYIVEVQCDLVVWRGKFIRAGDH